MALGSCFLALSVCSRARSQAPKPVLRVQTQLVLIPVHVIDGQTGLEVRGLRQSDFILSVDGKTASIQSYTEGLSSNLHLALAIILDLKGIQVSDQNKIAKTFLDPTWRDWLEETGPTMTVAALRTDRSGTRTEIVQGFTDNDQLILSAFKRLADVKTPPPPRKTRKVRRTHKSFDPALASAIGQAATLAAQVHGRGTDYIKDVVLVTEDVNMIEKAQNDQALALLRREGMVLSTVQANNFMMSIARGLAHKAAAASGSVSGIGAMDAEATGGLLVKTSSSQVASALQQLVANLNRGYTLAFEPTGPFASEGTHHISVQLRSGPNDARDRGKLKIAYRNAYVIRSTSFPEAASH